MDIRSVSLQCEFPQQEHPDRIPVRGPGEISLRLQAVGNPDVVAAIGDAFRSQPGSLAWLAQLYAALASEGLGQDQRGSHELSSAPDVGTAS